MPMPFRLPTRVPEPGFYHHFKRNPNGPAREGAYEVLGIGFHTEAGTMVAPPYSQEHFVNYRPLYEHQLYKLTRRFGILCVFTKPLGLWFSEAQRSGVYIPRYQKITDRAVIAELERIRDSMYPKR